MAPQIDVFVTSIQSNAALRGRHERVERALQSLRIQWTKHDVASSEEAKSYWKRKNNNNNELPCIIVDGERVGSIEEMDEAVEYGELRQFLRLDAPPATSASQTTAAGPTSSDALDDELASLNLSPEELASLSSASTQELGLEPNRPSGFVPTSLESRTASYTFTPTAPLSFGGTGGKTISVTGSGANREERVRAGSARPIAVDAKADEEMLDGLELSEEEARALARELGLDDDDELVTGAKKSPTSAAASKKDDLPSLPPSAEKGEGKKGEKEEEGPAVPKKEETPGQARSVEGHGGASLSAPVATIDQLQISPLEMAQIKTDIKEFGTTLKVKDPNVVDEEEARDPEVDKPLPLVLDDHHEDADTERKGAKRRGSSVGDINELKSALEKGSKGGEASPLPELEDNVIIAIKDGLI